MWPRGFAGAKACLQERLSLTADSQEPVVVLGKGAASSIALHFVDSAETQAGRLVLVARPGGVADILLFREPSLPCLWRRHRHTVSH